MWKAVVVLRGEVEGRVGAALEGLRLALVAQQGRQGVGSALQLEQRSRLGAARCAPRPVTRGDHGLGRRIDRSDTGLQLAGEELLEGAELLDRGPDLGEVDPRLAAEQADLRALQRSGQAPGRHAPRAPRQGVKRKLAQDGDGRADSDSRHGARVVGGRAPAHGASATLPRMSSPHVPESGPCVGILANPMFRSRRATARRPGQHHDARDQARPGLARRDRGGGRRRHPPARGEGALPHLHQRRGEPGAGRADRGAGRGRRAARGGFGACRGGHGPRRLRRAGGAGRRRHPAGGGTLRRGHAPGAALHRHQQRLPGLRGGHGGGPRGRARGLRPDRERAGGARLEVHPRGDSTGSRGTWR